MHTTGLCENLVRDSAQTSTAHIASKVPGPVPAPAATVQSIPMDITEGGATTTDSDARFQADLRQAMALLSAGESLPDVIVHHIVSSSTGGAKHAICRDGGQRRDCKPRDFSVSADSPEWLCDAGRDRT